MKAIQKQNTDPKIVDAEIQKSARVGSNGGRIGWQL